MVNTVEGSTSLRAMYCPREEMQQRFSNGNRRRSFMQLTNSDGLVTEPWKAEKPDRLHSWFRLEVTNQISRFGVDVVLFRVISAGGPKYPFRVAILQRARSGISVTYARVCQRNSVSMSNTALLLLRVNDGLMSRM
jgi:hypothetical protein